MRKSGLGSEQRRFRRMSPNWRRIPRRVYLVTAAIVLIALTALTVSLLVKRNGSVAGTSVVPAPAAAPAAPVEPSPPPLREEKILIPQGTSLARLLKQQSFDNKAINALKEAVKPVYDLARIKAGHEMRLVRAADGSWRTLEYDIDDTRYLVVRNESDAIKAEVKYYPFEIKPAFVWGIIEDSLIEAINRAGEESSLALDLVERCFGWDVDFYTDLRKGDSFKIVVEKKFLDGRFAGYRNILAAEFINEGKVHQAFRFIYPDTGTADYFDENGLSKRKEFLRSPFKFSARITSRFSSSRLHPIYKVYRPHYGVDYAAQIGTEVQATADGKVTFADWNGGSGRMVKLQHKNFYETLYLHLSRFPPGIRVGAQVRGGDIIGYVGTSGESTGPHLDYRIYYHGSPINPLGQKFKPADPVRKEFLEIYTGEVQKLRLALQAPSLFCGAMLFLSY